MLTEQGKTYYIAGQRGAYTVYHLYQDCGQGQQWGAELSPVKPEKPGWVCDYCVKRAEQNKVDTLQVQAAAMRSALEWARRWLAIYCLKEEGTYVFGSEHALLDKVTAALSSDAGKALAERVQALPLSK